MSEYIVDFEYQSPGDNSSKINRALSQKSSLRHWYELMYFAVSKFNNFPRFAETCDVTSIRDPPTRCDLSRLGIRSKY